MEEFRKQMQEKERITFSMLKNQTVEIMKSEELFKDILNKIALHISNSVSNTILVQAQLPNATAVLSIPEWEKRQCPVRRDENGFYPQGIFQFAYDGQYLDEQSGQAHSKFKIYKGYDASQTIDPDTAQTFVNDTPPVTVFFDNPEKIRNRALINSSPIKCLAYNPMSFIDEKEDISVADGVKYIPETKTVIIRKVARETWFQQVCFQIALGMYHRIDGIEYSAKKRNFEAAIVAYIVTKKMGIDTSSFHFNITGLSQTYSDKQFRKMLEQTNEFASDIAHRVNAKLKEQNVPKSPRPIIEQRGVPLS